MEQQNDEHIEKLKALEKHLGSRELVAVKIGWSKSAIDKWLSSGAVSSHSKRKISPRAGRDIDRIYAEEITT